MMTTFLLDEDFTLSPSLQTPEQETFTSSESLIARKNRSYEGTPSYADRSINDEHCCSESEDSELVYFPAKVNVDQLKDWKNPGASNNSEKKGELVNVNNTDVAVFKYGDKILATQARCPHAGGPLHLGDIEVLPDMSLCVRCPWHKWSFCVSRSRNPGSDVGIRRKLFNDDSRGQVTRARGQGECVWPPGRGEEGVGVKVYSTRVSKRRDTIKIGFESFDSQSLINSRASALWQLEEEPVSPSQGQPQRSSPSQRSLLDKPRSTRSLSRNLTTDQPRRKPRKWSLILKRTCSKPGHLDLLVLDLKQVEEPSRK